MPVLQTNVSEFLSLARQYPVFDVRSPSEFAHAHIPGARSLPVFSDEERKEIGTTYKQVSRQHAIKTGLRYFGPNMERFVQQVEETTKHYSDDDKLIGVHCWRGGMRSGAMAWLLDFYGFKVHILQGGYKAYRNHVLQQLEQPFLFNVIGGYTGSGKTEVLQELAKQGASIIDLEAIAGHKGSAFGALGLPAQPSQEQFENNLLQALTPFYATTQQGFHQTEALWIESESQRIGSVNLPNSFYHTMQQAPLYILDVPFEQRLSYIVKQYGALEREKLINAIIRIQKKLGGLDTKTAVNYLIENNVQECFRILLSYYDKRYQEARDKDSRTSIFIPAPHINTRQIAQDLLAQPPYRS